MKKVLVLALALTIPFAAGGCRRLTRSVTEKAIEQGTGAKNVDLDKGNMTVVGKDGQKVSFGQDTKLPDDWPSSVPVYPGAKLMSAMSMPDGWAITATVSDPPDKVISFYKSKLSSMTKEAELNMSGMSMVTFRSADQNVQVSAGGGNQNTLSLTVSKIKK